MPRPLCRGCQRPQKQCYCKALKEEAACMDIIILQHPRESRHPLNTARILELGIGNCEVWVGEDFSNHSQLLKTLAEKNCYLLFPGANARASQDVLRTETPEVLIILDGTWRKAKKIYYCNPLLQQLPGIELTDLSLSDYRIRKAPGAGALSTVEAAVNLLRQASRDSKAHQQLLDTFSLMIDQQINAMGQEVFRKNYPQGNG
ncbi:tRNA-uridine aminocarboxypropyltransferase [Endozoicomonas sp. SCSIO W0465]|uniref:tRNA-uridine aminocarboxypropyltransferase n=1 Tax=Endozoicomonas sp. SCSIO W0465 TaxID=2918516 RepID=UPI002075A665|nr:tRNA-uridine aminocarboxypropyltransferase [Endozoicomonas sp. SCSIO W0465]USE38387.1 DTW domain-containing protein [Endozoicomonas sp. SCSIO W0465]